MDLENWYATSVATGAIAMNTPALNQARAAFANLKTRLEDSKDPVATASQWFQETLAGGHVGRDPAATEQALEARQTLLDGLTAPAAPVLPLRAKPPVSDTPVE